MPSKHSPSSTQDRIECPDIAEEIGHDPARFLDHDLMTSEYQRLEIERDSSGSVVEARTVPDRYCSTGAAFVKSIISGIDRLEVIDAWLEVETQRLDRGPRKTVVAELNQRRAELEEIGERPDRLPEGPRRPPKWYHQDDDGDSDDEQLTAMEQLEKRAATDGGESP
ncbi:hypothetical protein [Halorhabdus amylolytica]|uniref:hypothetical protein n=1 Tax=Halorhabdus amylolytica TaxID=2559573 RepID=UPI0010AA0037|nr:hypothetical protein [Halorhabdus amylolytica]